MGGGAVATATGEGLPSTGFEGCNPTPRSAQQGTGGTPEPTRSAVLSFGGCEAHGIPPFKGDT